jgi:chlorite dismutase
MTDPLVVTFAGGSSGPWRIDRLDMVRGETLPPADSLRVIEASSPAGVASSDGATWTLRGVTSNERYVTREEHERLEAVQPPLGRIEATRAALIPIRKTPEWWDLAQDERRAIFEESSHHVRTGLGYLPAVARRLYHCRDLAQPFDFLTWFEFAPENATGFEELVRRLRDTREWDFVEREVDIRLSHS